MVVVVVVVVAVAAAVTVAMLLGFAGLGEGWLTSLRVDQITVGIGVTPCDNKQRLAGAQHV